MAPRHSLLRFRFSNFEQHTAGIMFADNDIMDNDNNEFGAHLWFEEDNDGEEWIAFSMYASSLPHIFGAFQISFILRDALGKVSHEDESVIQELENDEGDYFDDVQDIKFIKRSQVMEKSNNILIDGALIFEIELQPKPCYYDLHVPPNPLLTNLMELFESEKNTDITFIVKDETIRAHALILEASAPFLASLCKGGAKGTPITINETTPRAFRHVLRYIYGQTSIASSELMVLWKELIDAADRYNITHLKIMVETYAIQECIIDTKNVSDIILFADAKTCPLLKEFAMSYFVDRARDILESKHSVELQKSARLMKELMVAILDKSSNDEVFRANDLSKMTVCALRNSLALLKLDVDGSKEILVSRLENFKKGQST